MYHIWVAAIADGRSRVPQALRRAKHSIFPGGFITSYVLLETAIASMEIPAKEIAQAAVQIIIEEIAAGAVAEPRHITFKSSLIVRETT